MRFFVNYRPSRVFLFLLKSFLGHEDYSGFTHDSLEQSLQVFSYIANWRMSGFDLLGDSWDHPIWRMQKL
jgi:hypothetical protein